MLVDIANLSRNEDVDAAVIVLSRNDDTGELERHRLSPILPQGFLYGDESSPERERDRSRGQTSSSPVKETRMAARPPSIIPDHPQQRSYSGTDSGDPDESRGSFVAQMKSRYGSDQETVRPGASGHGHARTVRSRPRLSRADVDAGRHFARSPAAARVPPRVRPRPSLRPGRVEPAAAIVSPSADPRGQSQRRDRPFGHLRLQLVHGQALRPLAPAALVDDRPAAASDVHARLTASLIVCAPCLSSQAV